MARILARALDPSSEREPPPPPAGCATIPPSTKCCGCLPATSPPTPCDRGASGSSARCSPASASCSASSRAPSHVSRKVGRLEEPDKLVACQYTVTVEAGEKGRAAAVRWEPDRIQGTSLLRTSRVEWDEARIVR